MYFGEYECEISDGVVYLPEKFQLADKDMMLLVLEDEGIIFIRICDELIDEQWEELEQSSVILLEKKQIHINKDESFLLPEIFRQRMTMSKDTDVVVRGMGFDIEILSSSARDEEVDNFDACITALKEFLMIQ